MKTIVIDFEQHVSERLYPIGYIFKLKQGKQSVKECTITDYSITHSANGKVKSFKYNISYDFLGQRMHTDAAQATIDIATNNGWKVLNTANSPQ